MFLGQLVIRLKRVKFKLSDIKKQKFSETQIASILKQYDGGREAMKLFREYGISKATLYNWRKNYSGM